MMVLATAWPGLSVSVDTDDQTGEFTEVVQGPDGRQLFSRETFGGNGRTCRTCHSTATGTTSVADVAHRITNPNDPLFVHDGLDDDGAGTTRIEAHATIRMTISLPPGITLTDDPGATSVNVNRGIPTTKNTPALDPVLLADGRAPALQDQALGAILDHFQNTRNPTAAQLAAIAEFQQTDSTFFSSINLRRFADGGPPPELPEGHTAAEKRGRRFLVDVPFISVVHGTPVHHALSSIFHASPHGPHMVLTVSGVRCHGMEACRKPADSRDFVLRVIRDRRGRISGVIEGGDRRQGGVSRRGGARSGNRQDAGARGDEPAPRRGRAGLARQGTRPAE
jgi:Di-haem cytochrome c peroxidase